MPTRTGEQYIARLKDHQPAVYMGGEKVKDVTTHPALRNGIHTLARLYDLQHAGFETATVETPSPLTPTGAKGVGELPTVAAPAAVANAVMAALNGVGVRHIDTPLTPEKIWRAIHGIE